VSLAGKEEREPLYEEKSLMLLLGAKSLAELNQYLNAPLSDEDLLELSHMEDPPLPQEDEGEDDPWPPKEEKPRAIENVHAARIEPHKVTDSEIMLGLFDKDDNERSVAAVTALVEALYRQGQRFAGKEMALAEAPEAVNYHPDDPGAHHDLGELYEEGGLLELALEEYHVAADLEPDIPELRADCERIA
jgi:tetratricopeptide (TPR) repeat protein